MSNYIYHGNLNIYGKNIDASWTQGFGTIWVGDKTFNGYHELINYLHKNG